MKTKLLLTVMAAALALGFSSCSYDMYQKKSYPPVYRTYQDRNHGGMDAVHGGAESYR